LSLFKDTRLMMGMPITVEIIETPDDELGQRVFDWFDHVDKRFSPFIEGSEVCRFSRGEIGSGDLSDEMEEVLALAEATRIESHGAFNITRPTGFVDPSGIVKGWAISKAAKMIAATGARNFYVEAGGDIQASGLTDIGEAWTVGIQSPFNAREIIKVVALSGQGIATSGTYVRGDHIYDPREPGRKLDDVASISVIAEDVVDADRFATAAFAMGREGIYFLEGLSGIEGYMVDAGGIATQTSGFGRFVK
jgi:FAD:protein FMN transferase